MIDESDRTRRTTRRERAIAVTGSALAGVLLAVVVGAYIPAIPAVGMAGSGLAGLSGWIVLVAAAVVVLMVAAWRRSRTRVRAVFLGIAVAGLVGWVSIAGQLVAIGVNEGRGVNLFALPADASDPNHTVTYRQEDEPIELAVWEPRGSDAADAPVALFVHGGGWIVGDELGNSADKRWFADRGWLVISATYSLSTPEEHHWDKNYDEIQCAMVWAQQNASAYGGDPSTFVMLGDSAGGNLAISSAYQAARDGDGTACEGELPDVDAVATVYPAVDPVSFHNNPDLLLAGSSKNMTEQWIGGSPEEFPGRYAAGTSATYISKDAPPTLIVAAENDHLVPVTGANEFIDDAEAAGVHVTRIGIPFGEHVFDMFPAGKELYLGITERWLAENVLD